MNIQAQATSRDATQPTTYAKVAILCAVLILCAVPVAAQEGEVVQMDTLEVIGLTPAHGLNMPRALYPENVQVLGSEAIERSLSLDMTDALNAQLGSVHLNALGGNPFQPEVSYRGFRASPLLGLPQGLAVYQDGARVNETFGDVVNWDLIPESAISSIEVIPGSNPIFGLNALGGALSIQTKSGFTHAGYEGQTSGGSFGRFNVEAQAGQHGEQVGYFASGSFFREDGWRDFSESQSGQFFGKTTWIGEQSSIEGSATFGYTDLRGNGAVPVELLEQDRAAVFTHPDNTENLMGLLTLRGTHQLAQRVSLTATLYGRLTNTDTFNGDDSDYGACSEVDLEGLLCFGAEDEEEGEEEDDEPEEEERLVIDQNGNPVEATEAVSSATQNTSETRQRSLGGIVQVSVGQTVFGRDAQLVVGISGDGGWSDFSSQTELGALTDERGTIGSGLIDAESFTEVETTSRTASAFAVYRLSPVQNLSVMLSGRYNNTSVELRDQLGTALNGDHAYDRFNPALGATYQFSPSVGAFANLGLSNRAPTPVELTCADPEDPCRLPNGFQADPPLEQVIAQTVSGGLRGQISGIQWTLSAFRTDARDDIYFVSAGPARNSGFFTNIGDTRRQGIEAYMKGSTGRVEWYAAYTLMEATFEDEFLVNSPNHPDAEDGEIEVEAGDRIPFTPLHMAKGGADVAVTSSLSLGGQLQYNGPQYIRGDEANLLDPLDGYALLGLRGRYTFTSGLSIFALANNVFDTEYNTAGLLGEPDEVEAFEDFENPRFVTPGAPFAFRLGVEYAF